MKVQPFPTAKRHGLMQCLVCRALLPIADQATCWRCGSRVHLRKPNSLQRTLALTVTGLILFLPANIFPIMSVTQLGRADPSTILGGVVHLWHSGAYPLAFIVFFASVFVPLAKFVVLFYLCWYVKFGNKKDQRHLTHLYHITEAVGRWSMVDVFVVATLAALVQAGQLATISPGIAATAFAAMVVVTMIAAESFDSRLLWDD